MQIILEVAGIERTELFCKILEETQCDLPRRISILHAPQSAADIEHERQQVCIDMAQVFPGGEQRPDAEIHVLLDFLMKSIDLFRVRHLLLLITPDIGIEHLLDEDEYPPVQDIETCLVYLQDIFEHAAVLCAAYDFKAWIVPLAERLYRVELRPILECADDLVVCQPVEVVERQLDHPSIICRQVDSDPTFAFSGITGYLKGIPGFLDLEFIAFRDAVRFDPLPWQADGEGIGSDTVHFSSHGRAVEVLLYISSGYNYKNACNNYNYKGYIYAFDINPGMGADLMYYEQLLYSQLLTMLRRLPDPLDSSHVILKTQFKEVGYILTQLGCTSEPMAVEACEMADILETHRKIHDIIDNTKRKPLYLKELRTKHSLMRGMVYGVIAGRIIA